LDEYDASDIVEILKAAIEFNLEELIDFLQSFLIENKKNWMEQNFNIIYQISFENDSLPDLQEFCIELTSKEPEKILNSPNFVSMSEKALISLIQNDNLQISEVQVWEYVLKWGLAQNPGLSLDSPNCSKDDFITLKNTLQRCIPHMRFYNLSSTEFTNKVLPYKKVIPKELYKDLLVYFLEPGSKQSKPRISNATNINATIVTPLNAATTLNTTRESVVTSQPTTSNTAREPEVTSHLTSTTLNAAVTSQQTWEYEQPFLIETPLVNTRKGIQSLYQEYENSNDIYRQRILVCHHLLRINFI
jgi:hypothetical protein